MTSGIPKSGARKLHQRWTRELLYSLHQRWVAGEALLAIAIEAKTSQGRLRSAIISFGFEIPPRRKRGARIDAGHKSTAPSPENDAYEGYIQSLKFDAIRHRSARHYKGNFEL